MYVRIKNGHKSVSLTVLSEIKETIKKNKKFEEKKRHPRKLNHTMYIAIRNTIGFVYIIFFILNRK